MAGSWGGESAAGAGLEGGISAGGISAAGAGLAAGTSAGGGDEGGGYAAAGGDEVVYGGCAIAGMVVVSAGGGIEVASAGGGMLELAAAGGAAAAAAPSGAVPFCWMAVAVKASCDLSGVGLMLKVIPLPQWEVGFFCLQ